MTSAHDPIEAAAQAALDGSLIVLPTDTVYGIGARPDDPSATARLFDAKGRPRELELPVLVPSTEAARRIATFDERAEVLALRFWAGPVTIVLPRTELARVWDLGGDPTTIGVRMPHEPLALAVLARTGPLAMTSANRSGALTPTACDEIEATFADAVQVYLCAPEPLTGSASTVVDLAHGRPSVVRAGAVSERAIAEALRDLGPPGGPEGPV